MIRHVIFIIAISLWTVVSFGQTDSITEKIRLINSCTASLDTLIPLRDGDAAIIDSLNGQVTDLLLEILNNKNIVRYKIESLLHLHKTISPDKKLIVFSFFENTGGSYKSHINIVYYRLPDGEPRGGKLAFCKQDRGVGNEYGGTIDEISILKSKGKTKYLCRGGGISCNTCEFSHTALLSISDSSLQTDFCLDLDYRQGDGNVHYDPKTKTLSYRYTVSRDDILYGTGCDDGQEIAGNRCGHSGQYRFNGDTFVRAHK